jgi:ABC-type xylose transport system substrate-binding protein
LAQSAADLINAIIKQNEAAINDIINSKVNNGNRDVPAALLKSVVISKDNMKDAIKSYGIHSESQIYGKQ